MKKIFTLLFAVGFVTAAAYAQPGSRDSRDNQRNAPQTGQRDQPQYDQRNDPQNGQWDRDNGYSNGNDDRFYNSNGSKPVSMKILVARINHKYDLQVARVKNDRFMRRGEKTRMIRSIETQRQQELRMLYARSGNNRNGQHDRGYDSNPRF